LATRYANLCDYVFAPSESVQAVLERRGVTVPVQVVPTGVHPERFARGDGAGCRRRMGIPDDAFVIGHVGRLAPEKNLAFLAAAVADHAASDPRAHFLVVGGGPSETEIQTIFAQAGLADRLHRAGILQAQALTDALHAMDLFAFASTSETQGMVLTEAMAAGLPVVALDAPGAREVVEDRRNGRLLPVADPAAFASALTWTRTRSSDARSAMRQAALETADAFSMACSADTALAAYTRLVQTVHTSTAGDDSAWEELMTALKTEWAILKSMAGAGDAALGGRDPTDEQGP
jgi:glycosyltransferase involved in cell wall biosynthesis